MKKGPKEFMQADEELTKLMKLLSDGDGGIRVPTPEELISIMQQIDKCDSLAYRHKILNARSRERRGQSMRDLREICLDMLAARVKETRMQQGFDSVVVESSRMLVKDFEKDKSSINKFFSALEPVLEEVGQFAKAGRKQLATCKANAPKGGKATAHYTDLHFTLSFSQYREKQRDNKSAWDASHSLTRKGQPLDRYKQGSAYKRLQRMAKAEGLDVSEYYENLD